MRNKWKGEELGEVERREGDRSGGGRGRKEGWDPGPIPRSLQFTDLNSPAPPCAQYTKHVSEGGHIKWDTGQEPPFFGGNVGLSR